MPRLTANFTSPMGPDRPRDPRDATYFPASTSDGSAVSVPNAEILTVRSGVGETERNPVAKNPIDYYTTQNRCYCTGRRNFPSGI